MLSPVYQAGSKQRPAGSILFLCLFTQIRTDEGCDIPEAAYASSLCLLDETTLPNRTAKAGASAARAALTSAPKDLRPAKSADRA